MADKPTDEAVIVEENVLPDAPEVAAKSDEPGAISSTGEQPSLEQITAELDRVKKSYDNLRPEFTRTTQENAALREEQARLKGQLELLASQQSRGVDREQAVREQAEFDERWKALLAEHPEDSVEFYRGVAGELQASIQHELGRIRADMESKLESFDPVYRENAKDIDALVKAGMTRRDARLAIETLKPKKVAAEGPPRIRAPGRVEQQAATDAAPTKKVVRLPAALRELVSLAGMSEEDVREIATVEEE